VALFGDDLGTREAVVVCTMVGGASIEYEGVASFSALTKPTASMSS